VEAARRVGGAWTAPVLDADPDARVPWVATAYAAGPSLTAAVAEVGPLPPHTVRSLGAGLAEALSAVHALGLVHRDVKPSNVLLTLDGPLLIDFGIARAADGTASLTATGVSVGSPGYMAPEQILGKGVTGAADVFSLGAVLAFAASGRPPFHGDSSAALLYKVVHEEPEVGSLDGELGDLVVACLAKDPARRPSPQEVAGRLAPQGAARLVSGGWLPGRLVERVSRDVVELLNLDTGGQPGAGVAAGAGGAGAGGAGESGPVPFSRSSVGGEFGPPPRDMRDVPGHVPTVGDAPVPAPGRRAGTGPTSASGAAPATDPAPVSHPTPAGEPAPAGDPTAPDRAPAPDPTAPDRTPVSEPGATASPVQDVSPTTSPAGPTTSPAGPTTSPASPATSPFLHATAPTSNSDSKAKPAGRGRISLSLGATSDTGGDPNGRGRRVSCTLALSVAGALAAVTLGSVFVLDLLPGRGSDDGAVGSTPKPPAATGSPTSPEPTGAVPTGFLGTWEGPAVALGGALPDGTFRVSVQQAAVGKKLGTLHTTDPLGGVCDDVLVLRKVTGKRLQLTSTAVESNPDVCVKGTHPATLTLSGDTLTIVLTNSEAGDPVAKMRRLG
jgi:hypothetical protein